MRWCNYVTCKPCQKVCLKFTTLFLLCVPIMMNSVLFALLVDYIAIDNLSAGLEGNQ